MKAQPIHGTCATVPHLTPRQTSLVEHEHLCDEPPWNPRILLHTLLQEASTSRAEIQAFSPSYRGTDGVSQVQLGKMTSPMPHSP